MENLTSVHFCAECCEFGIVSVVNGRLTVESCKCELEEAN
jgi:hypothetical protein